MNTKICSKCGIEYPATTEYFSSEKRYKGGFHCYCRKCANINSKNWQKKNPGYNKEWNKKLKEKNPDYYQEKNLRNSYNLSLKDYNKMFEQQNGLCAICGLPESAKYRDKIKKLGVDHNHNTGEIRGLLCHKCNPAIGMLNVDNLGILNLEKAIEYLKGIE